MLNNTISVTQLNTYVKSLIENDVNLTSVSVTGEISNFKNHYASGHWYFTLKDKNASIRCVMFRSSAAKVRFEVSDGIEVVLRGRVSIYDKDGQYQFYAEDMRPVGEGDLALAFKQIKEKLEREGLFEQSSKRSIKKFPRRIAVITSDTGAAVKDVLNILNNRYPCCEVVMCPCLVQGDLAAQDMIKTLERVYALDGIDTIIIGRGGGSTEDLHCFNDEALARKIYESPIPVISAVGHETDFTICDFVSDARASTPSHAAELAVPNASELALRISQYERAIVSRTTAKINLMQAVLENIKHKAAFDKTEGFFEKKQLYLDRLSDRILTAENIKVQKCELRATELIAKIDALSPLKILSRGFATVLKNGNAVKRTRELTVGDNISVRFADGTVDCTVTERK